MSVYPDWLMQVGSGPGKTIIADREQFFQAEMISVDFSAQADFYFSACPSGVSFYAQPVETIFSISAVETAFRSDQ